MITDYFFSNALLEFFVLIICGQYKGIFVRFVDEIKLRVIILWLTNINISKDQKNRQLADINKLKFNKHVKLVQGVRILRI